MAIDLDHAGQAADRAEILEDRGKLVLRRVGGGQACGVLLGTETVSRRFECDRGIQMNGGGSKNSERQDNT
jgi:hypothetical protein